MLSIRDFLRHNLGRALEPLPPLDRLTAAWPVACGTTLAARARITDYTNNELHILVQDRLWLDQFLSMRGPLSASLARIARLPVTAIHFKVTR